MERLPYIDEHSISIGATRERAWELLVSTVRVDFGKAAPPALRMLLGLVPAEANHDRDDTLGAGDAIPGFAVAEAHAPERLALSGRHRLSRYALVFEITPEDGDRCTLRAHTWAEFPGLTGRAYRALVIGSGGHRLVVRRLLRRVARRV
jgi:hypothetical protein